MADRRGRRRRDHAQRASSDRDLRRSRGAADAGGAGAAEQESAAPDPRQSDRQPPPAGARRRRNGDDRRDVARPARGGLRARRALRNPAGQQQSGADERAALGGARPDRQGLDASRRAVQLRRPVLPSSLDQHLAALLSGAASADLGEHDQHRRRCPGRRAWLCPGDVPDRLRNHQAHLRSLPARLARGRPRPGRADRSARLCGADLCRRHRGARRAPEPRSFCGT